MTPEHIHLIKQIVLFLIVFGALMTYYYVAKPAFIMEHKAEGTSGETNYVVNNVKAVTLATVIAVLVVLVVFGILHMLHKADYERHSLSKSLSKSRSRSHKMSYSMGCSPCSKFNF